MVMVHGWEHVFNFELPKGNVKVRKSGSQEYAWSLEFQLRTTESKSFVCGILRLDTGKARGECMVFYINRFDKHLDRVGGGGDSKLFLTKNHLH